MARRIRLLTGTAGNPSLDTAVSRVVLEEVGAGEAPETLRLYRPQPHVAFGRQDAVAAGYPEAVAAARDHGFEAVERLAGGRAAVFHEDTIALAWAIPDPSARERIRERFELVAAVVVDALASLGVDARVGEVPGEYCPGEFSVNARGARKIMGVGQRVVRAAGHVGGVVVVDGSRRIRDVLVSVYEPMRFEWRPEVTGSIADEVGPLGFDTAAEALREQFDRRYELVEEPLDDELVARAHPRTREFEPS